MLGLTSSELSISVRHFLYLIIILSDWSFWDHGFMIYGFLVPVHNTNTLNCFDHYLVYLGLGVLQPK